MKKFTYSVLAASLLACFSNNHAHAIWSLVDDFETFTNGQEIHGINGWTTGNATTDRQAITDETNPSNLVLQVENDKSNAAGETGLWKGITPIPNSSTASTLYFRIFNPVNRLNDPENANQDNGSDWTVALIYSDPPAAETYPANALGPHVLVDSVNNGLVQPININDKNTGFATYGEMHEGTWHDMWYVIDNSTDTFDVYVSGGNYIGPTQISDDLGFRNGDALPNPGDPIDADLINFFIRINAGQATNERFFIDDIYLDTSGENLTLPASTFAQGDFNGGGIDLTDFQLLADNLFEDATSLGVTSTLDTYAVGDFNFNRTIDLDDFYLFRNAYALANPGAAQLSVQDLLIANGVPEPSSVVMIMVGLSANLMLVRRLRRRNVVQ